MRQTSLITGWLPVMVIAAALVSIAALAWSTRRRWHSLRAPEAAAALAATATALATAVAYLIFGVIDPFQYRFPPSFYAWFATAVLVVGVAATTWTDTPWSHRAVSLTAATSTVIAALSLVNTHYAYYPTIAALSGELSPFEVTQRQFDELREHARTTGEQPAHGVVLRVPIAGTASGFHPRPAVVYLPPSWFHPESHDFSVIMLLPGTPSTPGDWFRAGRADRVVDAAATANGGHGPIVVVPDVNGSMFADTECVDGPRGNAESYIVHDVTNYIIDELRGTTNPEQWALVGLSSGGTCALTLALRHPERYRVFADFSGDAQPNLGGRRETVANLYGGDETQWSAHDPATLLTHGGHSGMRGHFEAGRSDPGPRRSAERLAPLAAAASIDVTLTVRPGAHTYTFWRRAFADNYAWISHAIGLI